MNIDNTIFSIIIPVRNRPQLIRRCLTGVAEQSYKNYELILVGDNVLNDNIDLYQSSLDEIIGERGFFQNLVAVEGFSYGPSFTRNYGAKLAKGQYIAFIDDDDHWCENEYLQEVIAYLRKDDKVDYLISNQRGLSGDKVVIDNWLPQLNNITVIRPVTPDQLLSGSSFAHVNISIYRREFFIERLGGFTETCRYEEDRNLYYRALDKAEKIIYLPKVVSEHMIPIDADYHSITNQQTQLEKWEKSHNALRDALRRCKNRHIRKVIARNASYVCKNISEQVEDEWMKINMSLMALSYYFTFKWLVYTVVIILYAKIFR